MYDKHMTSIFWHIPWHTLCLCAGFSTHRPFLSLQCRLLRTLTCSASTRIQASRMAGPLTQQLPTEGGAAAMFTRLTCGCGVLLMASHLGGLSVEKTFERQVAAGEASKERAADSGRAPSASQGEKSLIQSNAGVWQFMS